MSGEFTANYNVGGDIDKIKNLKNVDNISKIENLKQLDNISKIENLDNINNLDNISNLDNVENINNLDNVGNVKTINNIKSLDEIGSIRGFASKTQPYNEMYMFNIPATKKNVETGEDYKFEIQLPDKEIEIMAITLTCSGYGEDDNYDLYFNNVQWFKNWYCSEVKEGLFLGTSTYVYKAPSNSVLKLVFKNDSGTAKKIWLGIRMLID